MAKLSQKGKSRPKKRTPYSKEVYKEDAEFEKKVRRDRANDPSWYTRNEALVTDAGKISFTQPIGLAYDFCNTGFLGGNPVHTIINGLSQDKLNVPSVLGLEYVPTYGHADDGFDAINIAAQRIYSKVRHENSGARNYFEPDLMLYLMACDQIFTLYVHMARAYGVIMDQNQRNRAIPKVLLNAMGFDYDELLHDMANYRMFLNASASRIASLAIPNTMPIFSRHIELPASVYKDTDDAKAQLYVFRPQCFGVYKEKTSSTGGYLKAHFMTYKRHLSEWYSLMETMIAAVRDSEDCGIISGDILKAFGAENLIRLPSIDPEYKTDIGYHPEMLGQIANVTIMPPVVYTIPTGFNEAPLIYQDPNNNVLKSNCTFRISAHANAGTAAVMYGSRRIMVGLTDSPTPEEVLVNSRLMCVPTSVVKDGENNYNLTCRHLGSEVVVKGTIYSQYEMEKFYEDTNPELPEYCQVSYCLLGNVAFLLRSTNKLAAFKFHPVCGITQYGEWDPAMDVDNFAIVQESDIAKMHDTCLLSMLDVPAVGYSAK